MSKYQVNDHSVLKVSKEEAKQGKSWHDIAQRRAHSQHGDGEMSEDDIHAVKKFDHTLHLPIPNPDEAAHAMETLEGKIKRLQGEEQEKARIRNEQAQQQVSQQHHQQGVKDSFEEEMDDWFKD